MTAARTTITEALILPLPKHAKDMPFKGVCPVGEILQVDEVLNLQEFVTIF
jgi:hypothetical protein